MAKKKKPPALKPPQFEVGTQVQGKLLIVDRHGVAWRVDVDEQRIERVIK